MQVIWQPGVHLNDIEKEVIVNALSFYKGDKKRTSKSLGISERTIYNKMKKYGLTKEDKPKDKSSQAS